MKILKRPGPYKALVYMAAYQNFQAQGWTAMAQKGQWG